MIISYEVEMKLGEKNYTFLKKKYNLDSNLMPGDTFKIKIDKLSKGSKSIVSVSCDYCGVILDVPYKRYNKSTEVINKYACSSKDCSTQKIKDVCNIKYGVDNPFQSTSVKEKSKETLKKKYGVEHPMLLDETKNKIRDTCVERYGVDNYSKTEEYKHKTKKTNLEKYGVEHVLQSSPVRDKGKLTNLEKYGVEHSQQSLIVREKTIMSNIINFGVEHSLQSEEVKSKIKKTNLEKYGVDNYAKTKECSAKIKKTNLEKYGVDNYTKTDEYKHKLKEVSLLKYGTDNFKKSEESRIEYKISNDEHYLKYIEDSISLFRCDCEKQHEFTISVSNYFNRIKNKTPLCTICYPISDNKSIKEKDLYIYIKDIYNGEVCKYRDKNFEIDAYIPGLNIGFEFNGLYWHSTKYKNRNYHLEKTNYFKKMGIRIIHIWEDDWIYKGDIIRSQIKNLLGLTNNRIYARKCEVREVDTKLSKSFLDENHIQGQVNSIIKIGLFHDNELVSIMTFDKFEGRIKMDQNEWNLSRFCNLINTNVIGSASKLLNYFMTKYNPDRVISYADSSWSLGDLYFRLGFNKISETMPDYKYLVNGRRIHKSRYRKSKTGISESKLNLLKIYDCGKIKFEIKKSE